MLGVLTNTRFDSRVEGLARKLFNINEELAEMEPNPLTSKQDNNIVETT
jgi:hypothetical protein